MPVDPNKKLAILGLFSCMNVSAEPYVLRKGRQGPCVAVIRNLTGFWLEDTDSITDRRGVGCLERCYCPSNLMAGGGALYVN
jgi:hypothetical protein